MSKRKLHRVLIYMSISGIFMAGFLLSGCAGAEAVPVRIQDQYVTTNINVKNNASVADVLKKAEIAVYDGDQVTPDLTETISGKQAEITIMRHADVTVTTDDGEKKEVELTGGTVADALAESGVKVGKNDYVNHAADAYLTDGMTISVVRRLSVSLTADGKSRSMIIRPMTVRDFLKEYEIKVGKLDRVTPAMDDMLADGSQVVIHRVTVKDQVETETVPFETKTKYSSSMYEGESKVEKNGAEGEKEVTYRITFVDGVEERREQVSEKITKEPVDKVVIKGTMEEPTESSSESSGSSAAPARSVVREEYFDDCDGTGHGYKIVYYSDGSTQQVEY